MENESTTKVADLASEFQKALSRPNRWGERQETNWRARYNIWAGQDASGRKKRKVLGKEPFPWDEASDARVPLVDSYVNEDVDTVMTALQGARLQAAPTESGDMAQANLVTHFVRWMFYNQMPERDREAELLANYMFERGMGVLGVFWKRETQLARQTMTMQQLSDQAPGIAEVIADPTREEEALDLTQGALPDLKKSEARRVVKELREQGTTTYDQPYLCEDRPVFVALCPGEDFFAPADATDLQKARMLFYREFMTRAQLEDAERANGWEREWIDEVIKQCKGKISNESRTAQRPVSSLDQNTVSGLNTEELYEVIHAFERRAGADRVPAIYYTVFSAHLQSKQGGQEFYGKRDLLNYQHGQYPFVAFDRERVNRRLDSARGYGELAFTWQQQLKTEWDSRADRASISTIPPLLHPAGRPPAKWGPAVRVPYIRPNEYQFADVPRYDRGSQDVEQSVRYVADRYFGRMVEGIDPNYARTRMQRLVTRWLECWHQALEQMFQLCQQFMPDQFFFRVVGSAKAQPLRASRQEIQGKFDLNITWNVLNQEPELLQAKLDLLLKLLGADINGVTDRTELMTVIFEYLDPNLGERLLQPAESASQREIDDEKTVFARLMTGQDVDVKPDGQAYQLREQIMQQELNTNPLAQQAYQSNERVREVVDKRMKQLRFQVQQRTVNPMIGRLGA